MRFSDESKASTHSHFRELHQWDVLTNRVHQDATHCDEGCRGRIPVQRRLHVDQVSSELSAKAWEVLADPSCPLRRPTKWGRFLGQIGTNSPALPKKSRIGGWHAQDLGPFSPLWAARRLQVVSFVAFFLPKWTRPLIGDIKIFLYWVIQNYSGVWINLFKPCLQKHNRFSF